MRAEQSDAHTYQPDADTLDGPADTVLADEHLPRDRDTLQQLLSSAHEDLARVGEILRTQRCSARLLGIDGSVIPLTGAASSIDPGSSEDSRLARVPALSAPIYDSQGRLFVSLQVV